MHGMAVTGGDGEAIKAVRVRPSCRRYSLFDDDDDGGAKGRAATDHSTK